jgi:hypothetical protein
MVVGHTFEGIVRGCLPVGQAEGELEDGKGEGVEPLQFSDAGGIM